MGKGDRKTRRGKIILGTYGVRRRRKKAKKVDLTELQSVKEKDTKGRRAVREKKPEAEAVKAGEETLVTKDKGEAGVKQSVKQEEKKTREVKADKDEKGGKEIQADKKIKKAVEEKVSSELKTGKEDEPAPEAKAEKDKESAAEEKPAKEAVKTAAEEKAAKSEES